MFLPFSFYFSIFSFLKCSKSVVALQDSLGKGHIMSWLYLLCIGSSSLFLVEQCTFWWKTRWESYLRGGGWVKSYLRTRIARLVPSMRRLTHLSQVSSLFSLLSLLSLAVPSQVPPGSLPGDFPFFPLEWCTFCKSLLLGEQGDPLMPLLFALGLHRAFTTVRERLLPSEKVFAFLDDVYVICAPHRVLAVHRILEEELQNHAQISLHHGKTQVWNRAGVPPQGIDIFTRVARRVNPEAIVWRGDTALPRSQQGVKVLGVPVGQPEFVLNFLERKTEEHSVLFQRIPAVEDPQAAWLLLLMCASTRANYWLRSVRPDLTEAFAHRHDDSVWECLRQILQITPDHHVARVTASLPFSVGGMGLPYSKQVEGGRSLGKLGWLPPYGAWASPHSGSDHGARDGQGPMPVRSPLGQCWGIAPLLPEPIPQNPASPSLGGSTKPHGVSSSTTPYTGQNCQTLSELWWGHSTDHWLQPRWRRSPRTGWLGSRLNPSVFSCCVGSDYPFPWPHAPADVAANSILLAIIEQRAVWRGFWGEEGFHLSKQQHRCAEKQGREWGPTLSSATWIWKGSTCSMDADWKSSRTAWRCGMGHNSLDTTLVSMLHRDGTARRTAADRNGAPLKQARRLKESTYPELSGEGGRARLVVLAAEVGGRWSEETAQFLRALAKAHAQTAPLILQNRVKAAWLRRWSNVLALPGLSHCPSWTSTRVLGRGLRYLRCMRFWGTIGLREVVFLACCCAWSGFCFSHTFAKKKSQV